VESHQHDPTMGMVRKEKREIKKESQCQELHPHSSPLITSNAMAKKGKQHPDYQKRASESTRKSKLKEILIGKTHRGGLRNWKRKSNSVKEAAKKQAPRAGWERGENGHKGKGEKSKKKSRRTRDKVEAWERKSAEKRGHVRTIPGETVET